MDIKGYSRNSQNILCVIKKILQDGFMEIVKITLKIYMVLSKCRQDKKFRISITLPFYLAMMKPN